MSSVGNYVELEYQKDLIAQLLKRAYINIEPEQHEELTEIVFAKIHQMNQMRAVLAGNSEESVIKTADEYGVTVDSVLDSFMYFTLVVESALLMKVLSECIKTKE
jgi:hypothetical protein